MPTTRTSSRFPWHTVLVVVLTVVLLWLFFRSIDFANAWAAMRQADGWLLTAAVIVTVATYGMRALRWQTLLAPIGETRFSVAFRTTIIGFAASFLLPGRVGEVLRPYLLARHEGLRASATFATVVVERLIDLATVLAMFGFALVTLDVDVDPIVRAAGAVAAGAAVGAVLLLIVLAGHPERLGRVTTSLTGWLPRPVGGAIAGFAATFAEGLRVMRSPGHLALALAWSVPLWLSLTFGVWLTSLAFGLTFSFVATFLVMGVLAFGVAAPTPGGAGGFHLAYAYSVTAFFGADPDAAGAAAIVLHAVSFVPVTLLGLVFMWQDGLSLGRLRRLRADATAEAG
jgi:uncharacterized protein (TIRG00374 family)